VNKIILDFLAQNCPAILIFFAGGFIFWTVAKWYFIRFKKLELETLKISSLSDRIVSIESTYRVTDSVNVRIEKTLDEKILPKLDKAANSLNLLISHLAVNDKNIKIGIFKVESPVQITSIGIQILEFYTALDYLIANEKTLLQIIERINPQNPLDLENETRQLLLDKSTLPEFTSIKHALFNNPVFHFDKEQVQIPLTLLIEIMTIYLRNAFIREHPEIEQ
jgi:hypothetical protein